MGIGYLLAEIPCRFTRVGRGAGVVVRLRQRPTCRGSRFSNHCAEVHTHLTCSPMMARRGGARRRVCPLAALRRWSQRRDFRRRTHECARDQAAIRHLSRVRSAKREFTSVHRQTSAAAPHRLTSPLLAKVLLHDRNANDRAPMAQAVAKHHTTSPFSMHSA